MAIAGPCPDTLIRVRHPTWVVDYEELGYGQVRVEAPLGAWRRREPRTVHLYPPRTAFWEDTRRERRPRRSAWFNFTGGDQAGLRGLIDPQHGFAAFADPDGVVGALFNEAAELGQRLGDAGFWPVQSRLAAVVAALLRATPAAAPDFRIAGPEADAAPDGFAAQVLALLRTRLGRPTSCRQLAERLGVSPSTLAHRFKRETGEAPLAALRRLRIERAQSLLLKGEALAGVAAQLGFCDQFHLSKAFKRATGASPRAFLRRRGGTVQSDT